MTFSLSEFHCLYKFWNFYFEDISLKPPVGLKGVILSLPPPIFSHHHILPWISKSLLMDHLMSCLLTSVSPHFGVRVIFSKDNLNHFTKSPISPSILLFFPCVCVCVCECVCAKLLQFRQAPWSIGFSRQESWSGLPWPPLGDLPNPGIEPRSPTLQADDLSSEPQGSNLHPLHCKVDS